MSTQKQQPETPEAAPATEDKMAQLTPYQVLDAVSQAAQHAARTATGNETRDAFTAFVRALSAQFGGSDGTLG